MLAALGGLLAAFVVTHLHTLTRVSQPLDTDGQLLRAANRHLSLREGIALSPQLGQPSWGEEGVRWVGEASPYPLGYTLAWLPALVLGGADEGVLRAWSVGWSAVGLGALGLLAWRVAGRWGALAAVGLGVGSPVWNGLARAATVDGVVVALGLLGAAVAARGAPTLGAAWTLGLFSAWAVQVKWSAVVLLGPAWLVLLVGLWVERRETRPAITGVVAVGGALAAGAAAATAGAWDPGAPFVSRGLAEALVAVLLLAGFLAAVARSAGPYARGLLLAAGLLYGPGCAWYLVNGPVFAEYLDGHRADVAPTPLSSLPAFVASFLVTGAWLGPAWVVGGLALAGRARQPALARAGAVTAALAAGALALSGSPDIFLNGSIASRQLLGLVPWVALGGAVVAGGIGRFGPPLAAALAVAGLVSTASGGAWPCDPPRGSAGMYRSCGGLLGLPRWRVVAGPAHTRSLRLGEVPAAVPLRVTPVLVPRTARVDPDERLYLRGLYLQRRAFTPVQVGPAGPDPWVEANLGRFDDLVVVGARPGPAVLQTLGAAPPRALDLGPVPAWLVEGRSDHP